MSNDFQQQLSLYPIHIELPVQWGDMDAAAHVNNLVYLRWSESGRIAYFEKMGMDTSFTADDAGPILGWQDCKYIFPMTYPDTAIVGTRTHEVREDRIIMECAVFSKKHKRIASISKQSVVPYNYALLKKVALPSDWLAAIERLEENKI